MHQTFYIDTDEEISSIVDRLRRSTTTKNYFVVPMRAIFLQSVVNMKLLKREADKMGKYVVVVTQDEMGAAMAARAGIDVEQNVEDESTSEVIENPLTSTEGADESDKNEEEYEIHRPQEKNDRLNGLGSSDYFDTVPPEKERKNVKSTKKLTVSDRRGRMARNAKIDLRNHPKAKGSQATNNRNQSIAGNHSSRRASFANHLDPEKERTLEKMFSTQQPLVMEKTEPSKKEGKTKKVFFAFTLTSIVVFLCIAVYLFLPTAKVDIKLNIQTLKTDTTIKAKPQPDGNQIATRSFEVSDSVTLSFEATGEAEGSGQKARGKVVIYNEYSNAPQQLIASTRISSEDGRIFRIVKNVTVPGTTKVAGETKSGAIEVEVIADETGADYNIDPMTFKIPGFQGGDKYDKFFAKSTAAMSGGSDGDGSRSVSQKDLDASIKEAEVQLNKKIQEDIQSKLQTGEIALLQAQKKIDGKSTVSAKVKDVAETFEVNSSSLIHVIVFEEDQLKKIILSSMKNADKKDTDYKVNKIEYGDVEPDFENDSLNLRVYADIVATPYVPLDQLKKELLGKGADELELVLKKYPSIKSANVEFQPKMISRIPQYESRVDIEIQNE